jgi:eukaryotic-like serine/threonine-protein kinase
MDERSHHHDDSSRLPGRGDHPFSIAFGSNSAQRPGVLKTLTDSFGQVPRILLHDNDADNPLVHPTSDEVAAGTDAVGRYQLFGEIARGGMGAVLKARDPDLGRELAVKVLLEKHCDDPEMVCRFVEEAQIAGQLQHPGIVPIYELGTISGQRPYFAMRLLKGQTLAALVSERPFPRHDFSRFMAVFEAVAQTVAYAHARGVIHRDLKPSNVMVGAFGEVQVVDWGLAKVLPQGGAVDDAGAGWPDDDTIIATARSTSDSDISLAGSVMGTPSYMAPEQARGEVVALDERSDVFALGSILAELMTGKPAFTGRSSNEIHRKASRGDLAPAFALLDASQFDPELIALAKSCLAPEQDARPRDAGAIARAVASHRTGVEDRLRAAEISRAAETAHALEAMRTAEAAEARANAERRARRLTAALAASVLVLAALGGAVAFRLAQQRQIMASRIARELAETESLRDSARVHADDPLPWQALVESVKRAEIVARDGRSGPETDARLAALKTEADDGFRTASQDRALLQKLVEIRASRQDAGPVGSHAAYEAAFREAGFDFNTLSPSEAATALKRRPASVRAEIATFLDDWYRSDLVFEGEHEAALENRLLRTDDDSIERSGASKLRELARLIDPDEFRDRLRSLPDDGSLKSFLGKLKELAADPRAETLPAPTAVLLASFFEAAGEIDAAILILRKAVIKHPEDLWVNYRLAANLQNASPPRLEEAARYFTAARSIRPSTAHMLAHVLSLLERTEQATAIFLDLAARQPAAWNHLACLAGEIHALGPGKKREAQSIATSLIPKLRAEVEKSPNARAYSFLSKMLALMDDPAGALAALRELDKLDPRMKFYTHDMMGAVHLVAHDYERAISEFRAAILLKPGNPTYRLHLGIALNDLGKYDEAIVELREATRLSPLDFKVRVNLGHALILGDKTEEGLVAYREAFRLQPTRVASHLALAKDLVTRGKVDAAIAAYREAARVDPDNVDPHLLLGDYLLQTKQDYAGALAEFREVLRINPDEPDIRSVIGVVLFMAGKPKEALEACREAARLRPDRPNVRLNYGEMLATVNQDLDAALVEMQAAVRLLPDASSYIGLGEIFTARKNRPEAIAAYKKALSLVPNISKQADDLRRRISELERENDSKDTSLPH